MKSRKKSTIIICIAVFCFLYIIFGFKPLQSELHLTPEWTEDIYHLQEKTENDILLAYKLRQNIGYFTPEGKIVTKITFPFKSSISDDFYSVYGADSSSVNFYSPEGESVFSVNKSGFPFIDKDRIFLMLPGGTSFAAINPDGSTKWQYEYYSPITSFSSSKNGTVAGYLDGTIISFTNEGKIDQKFSPGGSNLEIILGAGISSEGNLIACISGQNQQRFVVAEKSEGHSRVIYHEYINKDCPYQSLVQFSKDDKVIFFDTEDFLGILDLKKLKTAHIPLEGRVIQIEESETENLIFVLSKKDNCYTVTVIEPFANPVAQFSYNAECSFIRVYENALFIGKNSKISRLTVSKK